MKYLLALDQGTTSSRALLFTLEGRPVAMAQREFRQLYPRPGWVEHDPLEIWETTLWAAREALRRAGVEAGEVLALGITNQRETTLLWDRKTGEPLYNAIVWQDRRTAPLCEALRGRGLEPLFRERTGLLLDPYFSGTKLLWLLENVPGLREKAERGKVLFGTVDAWLTWNLTGGKVHATDPTNASRTLLFNLHTLAWTRSFWRPSGFPPLSSRRCALRTGILGKPSLNSSGLPYPSGGSWGTSRRPSSGRGPWERGRGSAPTGPGPSSS